MLYDGHINCGADILSEDTSDKPDKYYEEIANDEDLQGDTTESSQNSDPDVLDDYYLEFKALTEAANDKKINDNMARLATECAGLCSIEECDTEDGTLF
ncbi:hypothetical protein [Candidatus Nanosynbacter sp. HMT-352]|jgi:hypothetical protein|uniref:hypothetical protein n=1 Tax=Candidatus Nanosynbacter sp. HMT-352 TaxID=2899133 RepID=UPI001E622BFE|nr:hypothetical protein [Candidatus Nanosynbacter sp. HMT-352]UHA57064.1 hypothetical protein LR957_01915 [Candidatus Nanosynbacter sp. HMT-352]